MLEWDEERVSLSAPPSALGEAGAAVSVGGSLLGLAILGLAIYGVVVLIRKA
jgi:hypothetical protein